MSEGLSGDALFDFLTVATPGDATASIAFTAGDANNAAITNYQYKIDSGSFVSFSPADIATPVVVTGLTNGVLVSIVLRAVNSIGQGATSAAVTVTPTAP